MASSIGSSDGSCHGGAKRPLRGQSLKDVQSLRMVQNHPPLTDDDLVSYNNLLQITLHIFVFFSQHVRVEGSNKNSQQNLMGINKDLLNSKNFCWYQQTLVKLNKTSLKEIKKI